MKLTLFGFEFQLRRKREEPTPVGTAREPVSTCENACLTVRIHDPDARMVQWLMGNLDQMQRDGEIHDAIEVIGPPVRVPFDPREPLVRPPDTGPANQMVM